MLFNVLTITISWIYKNKFCVQIAGADQIDMYYLGFEKVFAPLEPVCTILNIIALICDPFLIILFKLIIFDYSILFYTNWE